MTFPCFIIFILSSLFPPSRASILGDIANDLKAAKESEFKILEDKMLETHVDSSRIQNVLLTNVERHPVNAKVSVESSEGSASVNGALQRSSGRVAANIEGVGNIQNGDAEARADGRVGAQMLEEIENGNTVSSVSGVASGGLSGTIDGILSGSVGGDVDGSASGIVDGTLAMDAGSSGVGITVDGSVGHGDVDGTASGSVNGEIDGIATGALSGSVDGAASGNVDGDSSFRVDNSGVAASVTGSVDSGSADGFASGIASGTIDEIMSGTATGSVGGAASGSVDGEAGASASSGGVKAAVEGMVNEGHADGVASGGAYGNLGGDSSGVASGTVEGVVSGNIEGSTEWSTGSDETSTTPSVMPTVMQNGCIEYMVTMSDSWGDGWNGNVLHIGEVTVTLPSGSGATTIVCLPPGSYSPFACGGNWASEVFWDIGGVISGGADSWCSPSSGTFVVPNCVEFVVTMYDSYGDGWNGNILYIGDVTVTMASGSGPVTTTVCLPPLIYSPYACGGGWPYEVSWDIGGVISGGANSECTAEWGSFNAGALSTSTPSSHPVPAPTPGPSSPPTQTSLFCDFSSTACVCDFDPSSCTWSSPSGLTWTRQSGTTSSIDTGPPSPSPGSGGYYMYTEATSPNFPSKTFNLVLPVGSTGVGDISFYYNMYGIAMGSLSVETSADNGVTWTSALWSKSGDQGTSWHYALFSADERQATHVRFQGVSGNSYTSDMAIDDVAFTAPKQPSPAPTAAPTGGGYCFSGDSTVLVADPISKATTAKPLREVQVGDKVVSVNHKRERRLATVKHLPHSRSLGDFIHIRLEDTTPNQGQTSHASSSVSSFAPRGGHQLRATEHHTFPVCGPRSRHLRSTHNPAFVKAHELKAGDCLLTLEGERTVASANRRLAGRDDETFTVELEGNADLIVVGGVVTHAKPSHGEAQHKPRNFHALERNIHLNYERMHAMRMKFLESAKAKERMGSDVSEQVGPG